MKTSALKFNKHYLYELEKDHIKVVYEVQYIPGSDEAPIWEFMITEAIYSSESFFAYGTTMSLFLSQKEVEEFISELDYITYIEDLYEDSSVKK